MKGEKTGDFNRNQQWEILINLFHFHFPFGFLSLVTSTKTNLRKFKNTGEGWQKQQQQTVKHWNEWANERNERLRKTHEIALCAQKTNKLAR